MSQPPPPYGAPPPPPAGPPGGPPPGGPPPGGPPSGPPSFPPPGGPWGPGGPDGPSTAARGSGKGRWIALGIVGVVLLVGVMIGLVVALSDDDDDDGDRRGDDSSDGGPEDVVEDLVDAAEDGDCAAAERLLTQQAQAADPCESEAFQLLASEDVESEVHEASIDGSTASVRADFTSQHGSADYTFLLEKVDGTWLVTSYAASRTTGSDGPDAGSSDAPTGSATIPPTSGAGPSAGGTSTADAVPDDPAAVVEAFFDSAFAGDCATAEDLVTERYLAAEGGCDMDDIPSGLGDSVTYDIGTPVVDDAGGTATVTVELTAFGSTESTVLELAREGGRWRIDKTG